MLRGCLEDGIRHYNNYIVVALVTNTSSSRRVVLDNKEAMRFSKNFVVFKEQGIRLFFSRIIQPADQSSRNTVVGFLVTLQGTSISYSCKRIIIFKHALGENMLVPSKVFITYHSRNHPALRPPGTPAVRGSKNREHFWICLLKGIWNAPKIIW